MKGMNFLNAYKSVKCNISRACEAVNIDRKTFYNWLEKYPKFAKQVKEIEDSLDDKIEGVLFRNAELGRQRAVEFWLTNHKKNKYSNTIKNELTGKDGAPLTFIIEKSYESKDDKNKINP